MNDQPVEIFRAYQEYLQPARFKCAYGGRGSAKTRTFCTILTDNVMYYGWRVVCFREIQNSIEESVYQEFVEEIKRRDLESHFQILKTEILCPSSGGVIKFSGIKANQKSLDSQKLKGFSHFDACWLEEANPVSAESWNALIPTMRKEGSEIWVSFNPESPLEETYKRFVTNRTYPDYKDGKRFCIVKKINYTDNPRFPKELIDDMEIMKENDFELYRHVYLGEPVANSDLSIIKPFHISACIDAHLKLDMPQTGFKQMGFDVSDEGKDKNAVVWQQASIVLGVEEWKDIDPANAAQYAHGLCLKHGIEMLVYDSIGVGAGVKGELRQEQSRILQSNVRGFQRVTVEGFNAGGTVVKPESNYAQGKKNKDMFLNAKAQAWWLMADRFKNTYDALNGKKHDPNNLISIPDNDKLIAELSQPRREFVNGKVKVESKADMKKRGVNSPNLADALIMAYINATPFNLSSLT